MYKTFFEDKKAVIFDIDGTIFKESREFRIKALKKVLENMKLSYIDPDPYCISGYASKEVWDAILYANDIKDIDINELVNKTEEAYIDLIKNTELEPTDGFWDIFYELKQEKNFKTAITTNTRRSTQEIVMEKLDIKGVFDVEVFADDVRRPKPNPEIYKKALKLLKVRSKETICFEDSIPGAKSSVEAGIDTIVIWDGETRKSFFGDKILDFSMDFTPYPGNLDETHIEYVVRSYKDAVEKR